jgi:hypothetical protein
MKDQEFKQRLSEVADWKIPDTPKDLGMLTRKRKGSKKHEPDEPDEPDELDEDLDSEDQDQPLACVNQTHAPILLKVHVQAVDCNDCGQHCPNGRQTEAKLFKKNGQAAWKQHCITCGKFENPYTGEFNLNGLTANMKFQDYMRGSKGAYNTRANQRRVSGMLTQNQEVNYEIEDSDSIITVYHDFTQNK